MSTDLVIIETQIIKVAEVRASMSPEKESQILERKEMEGDSQSPLMTWIIEQLNDCDKLLE